MYDPTQKISLVTVPHTGTHFAIELLKTVGLEHRSASKGGKADTDFNFFQVHWPQKGISRIGSSQWKKIISSKIIVTARDPYLTGIRYISNGKSIEEVANCWDSFMECESHLDYFALDVGCAEEKRYDHVCDAIKHGNVDPEPHAKKIKTYADAWAPLNSNPSELKTKYLETGELPEEYNWELLDEAVDWYKSLPTNAHR